MQSSVQLVNCADPCPDDVLKSPYVKDGAQQ